MVLSRSLWRNRILYSSNDHIWLLVLRRRISISINLPQFSCLKQFNTAMDKLKNGWMYTQWITFIGNDLLEFNTPIESPSTIFLISGSVKFIDTIYTHFQGISPKVFIVDRYLRMRRIINSTVTWTSISHQEVGGCTTFRKISPQKM